MLPFIGFKREQVVVVAGNIENCSEINLEELFGDRSRACVVQSPVRAVGENAPAELAGSQVVDSAEVTQHLGGWRGLLAPSPGAAVERTKPAFRLHNYFAVLVSRPFLGNLVGALLGVGVSE
ncbi:MAG: hypothetical protein OXF94_12820 [Gammaproteobacteria bacterium]|nr:hypothetical protein [Gammaproteobacteria bacterium]